jgi:hypothetical protein
MSITGLSEVSDLINTAIKTIWPDKSAQEQQEIAAAVMVVQGQIDTNKEEAKSPSVFVSGWRPFIGWVCGLACAWNWIGLPMAMFGTKIAGYSVELAPASLTEMMPILIGMLGLGGLRTVERLNGVAAVTHK